MQAKCLLLWSALAAMAVPSLAHAQTGVRWQTTLEGAKRVAAQNNLLVLIHFWAPYCTACRRMEQEVFPDPAVAGALQAYYVPVKINTEYFPATANQFGITSLPTDIVLTPQGQVLAKMEGMMKPSDYSMRLCQAATSTRPQSPPPVYAQVPAGQTSPPPAQPGVAPPSQPAPVAGPIAAAPANPYAGMVPAPTIPRQTALAPVNPAPAPSGNPPLAMEGFCPVRLVEAQKWVPGDSRWGVIHQGRTYLFAGAGEQARFYAKPDVYAPVMSGNDVVLALETGQMVPGDRRHGVYYGNHVYMFAGEDSLQKFEREPDRYAGAAQQVLRAASYAPARQ